MTRKSLFNFFFFFFLPEVIVDSYKCYNQNAKNNKVFSMLKINYYTFNFCLLHTFFFGQHGPSKNQKKNSMDLVLRETNNKLFIVIIE